jgi:hypothetical protein
VGSMFWVNDDSRPVVPKLGVEPDPGQRPLAGELRHRDRLHLRIDEHRSVCIETRGPRHVEGARPGWLNRFDGGQTLGPTW